MGKLLKSAWPELEVSVRTITTRGDQVLDTPVPLIGGKGMFTTELEVALQSEEIDCAVHSLKDLPGENTPGLVTGAIPSRAHPGDALISRAGYTLTSLPRRTTVGTSSRRRAAQLLYRRPDLRILDIRGNVDSRSRKAFDPAGDYDAIVLAVAGLERLGQTQVIMEKLSPDDMLPSPGQAALAVRCRDESDVLAWLLPLNHRPSQQAVAAERAFLAGLGGGCSLPIAAYAEMEGDTLQLRGRVTAPDGSEQIDVFLSGSADFSSARELGLGLAAIALEKGVGRLLKDIH